MNAQARTTTSLVSRLTRLVPALALLAFAATGTGCDLGPVQIPGLTDQMDLAAPAPVVPCDPKPSAIR